VTLMKIRVDDMEKRPHRSALKVPGSARLEILHCETRTSATAIHHEMKVQR